MTILAAGMIGLGVVSRYYTKAFAKATRLSLVAVCDRDERKLDEAQTSGLMVSRDYHDLLCRPDVEAVVINLPNDVHFLACKTALQAGKHVCCEKPLTLNVAEARELVMLARQRRLTLLTAFHRRHNVNVVAAKTAVGKRRISRIVARYWERIEDHCGQDQWYLVPHRSGGGCIADNGPNVFDTLALFLGKLFVTESRIECFRAGVDLKARVLLAGNGGAAEVYLDWGYAGEAKDLDIQLTDGEVIHADMLAGFAGFKSSLDHEYEAILADFAARIVKMDTFGEDGLAAVELVTEAYRLAGSVTTGIAGVSAMEVQHERA